MLRPSAPSSPNLTPLTCVGSLTPSRACSAANYPRWRTCCGTMATTSPRSPISLRRIGKDLEHQPAGTFQQGDWSDPDWLIQEICTSVVGPRLWELRAECSWEFTCPVSIRLGCSGKSFLSCERVNRSQPWRPIQGFARQPCSGGSVRPSLTPESLRASRAWRPTS